MDPSVIKTRRDPRIDFFRGLALFMILFDHVMDDPIGKLTFRRLGLSDGAEIFVFLSGVSCGIVYDRIRSRGGWSAILSAIAKRTTYIYAFFLVVSFSTLYLTAWLNWLHQGVPFFVPTSEILSSITLTAPPFLAGILVLYIFLTLIFLPLFLALAEINAGVALAFSGVIWALALCDPQFSSPLPEHALFSVLSWQFLFSIGIFVGLTFYSQHTPLSLPSGKLAIWAAWAVVVLTVIYKIGRHLALQYGFALEWFPTNDDLQHMKTQLSPVRIIHFLSVAFLVATYLKIDSWIFRNPVAEVVVETGQYSLEVYCVSILLSTVLNFLASNFPLTTIEHLILDGCAILMILMTVNISAALRSRKNVRVQKEALPAVQRDWK